MLLIIYVSVISWILHAFLIDSCLWSIGRQMHRWRHPGLTIKNKQIPCVLHWLCTATDHRICQNVVRITGSASSATFLFLPHLWSITERTYNNREVQNSALPISSLEQFSFHWRATHLGYWVDEFLKYFWLIGQVLTEMVECQYDKRFSLLHFGSVTWHKRFRVVWNGQSYRQMVDRKPLWYSVASTNPP